MTASLVDESDYTSNLPHLNGGWRALQIFSVYRLAIACALILSWYVGDSVIYLGEKAPLFSHTLSWLYGLGALGAVFMAYQHKYDFNTLTISQTCIDIIVLVIFIHLSTDMVGSLGVMINIVIAASSLLLSGRLSIFFAALATTLLLVEALFTNQDLVFFALLGSSFFATSILAHTLSRRARMSEVLAGERGDALAKLERLNSRIIERLHCGIIVVDANWQVQLINHAARNDFGLADNDPVGHVSEVSEQLAEYLERWQTDPLTQSQPIQATLGMKLVASFTPLSRDGNVSTLIFLEDRLSLSKQAQDMKLASLGRFTSSIAHELRNPLGAISYATQLMTEDETQEDDRARLLTIIIQQTQRMNDVIKNILQLSRRSQTIPSQIQLKLWLDEFIEQYKSQIDERDTVIANVKPENFVINMDPSQLTQILTNLCDNGLRAGRKNSTCGKVIIRTGFTEKLLQPYLEVLDNGAGIQPDQIEKIFEPFYTTDRTGTGLGLYIVNELCQANHASLQVMTHEGKGACFRIRFEK